LLRIVRRILPILALIVLLVLFIHRLSHLLEHLLLLVLLHLLLLVLVLHLLVMLHLLLLLLLHHGIIIYLIFFNWRMDIVNGRAVNGVVSNYVSCFGGRELFLFDDFRWRWIHLSKRVWTLLKTLLFAQSFFSFFLAFGR